MITHTHSHTYSHEAVEQILRQASQIDQSAGISREQLFDVAAELGLSTEVVQTAESQWLTQQAELKRKAEKRSRRRMAFQAHLLPYLFVNAFLVVINLVTTPHDFWSIYPILGWGLGLALHGVHIFSGVKKVI
ncbi:MAG: 2TM domain-containing protein [Cyanobacteria bacterium P01_G01_bin.38]